MPSNGVRGGAWKEEDWMAGGTRELYSSSNGDTWYLVRDGERVLVKHVPNAASGGRASHVEIGAFLAAGGKSPEQLALLRLIGTLVDEGGDP